MRSSVAALTGCFALVGCTSAAEQQAEKMDAALTPYLRGSIADYVLNHAMLLCKLLVVMLLFVLLSACGTAEVAQTGPTTYSVSAQYGSVSGSWDRARDEASAKAAQFCEAKGQQVALLDELRSGTLGWTPQKVEVHFRCGGPSAAADAAIQECNEKRKRGELKSFKASVECSNPKIYAAWKEVGDANLDLLNLWLAARLVGAENVDKGKITEAEYQLQLAELNTRITNEKRRRSFANVQVASQLQATQAQSAAALLQGLAALQSASRSSR